MSHLIKSLNRLLYSLIAVEERTRQLTSHQIARLMEKFNWRISEVLDSLLDGPFRMNGQFWTVSGPHKAACRAFGIPQGDLI
jgi:hypothetical protein